MKVRELIEALQEHDPERTVVVPWSVPKTARECVEVREVHMHLTGDDDFVGHDDERGTSRWAVVVALAPASRGKAKDS